MVVPGPESESGHDLSLTLESGRKYIPELGAIWVDENRELQTGLWLAMMQQKWGIDGHGRWAPYVSILPSEVECPLSWNEKELELLGASMIAVDVRRRHRFLENKYQDMLVDGLFTLGDAAWSPEVYTIERFKWAASVMYSRAVPYPVTRNERSMALVPLLDMLNHDAASPNVKVSTVGRQGWEVLTTRTITEGEELRFSYGDVGNDRLLRNYGFVLLNNPANEVHFDALEGIGLEALGRKWLQSKSLSMHYNHYFSVKGDGVEPSDGLMTAVRVRATLGADEGVWEVALDGPIDRGTERQALKELKKLIKGQKKRTKDSLTALEDKKDSDDVSQARWRIAKQVLEEELAMLEAGLVWADDAMLKTISLPRENGILVQRKRSRGHSQ